MAVSKHEAGHGNFTYEDLLYPLDDGKRYEVLEGGLLVSPAPKVKHRRIVKRLQRLLMRAEAAVHGEGFPAPLNRVRAPDSLDGP